MVGTGQPLYACKLLAALFVVCLRILWPMLLYQMVSNNKYMLMNGTIDCTVIEQRETRVNVWNLRWCCFPVFVFKYCEVLLPRASFLSMQGLFGILSRRCCRYDRGTMTTKINYAYCSVIKNVKHVEWSTPSPTWSSSSLQEGSDGYTASIYHDVRPTILGHGPSVVPIQRRNFHILELDSYSTLYPPAVNVPTSWWVEQ